MVSFSVLLPERLAPWALHLRHPCFPKGNGLLRSAIRLQSSLPESATPSAAYAFSCKLHLATYKIIIDIILHKMRFVNIRSDFFRKVQKLGKIIYVSVKICFHFFDVFLG